MHDNSSLEIQPVANTNEVQQFPWDRLIPLGMRLMVWCIFFLILYILRSFFLLVFLTFVFSYIQANGVQLLNRYFKSRSLCVVLVGLCFLGIVIGIGAYLGPRVAAQARLFAKNYPSYLKTMDSKLSALAQEHSLIQDYLPIELKDTGSDTASWSLTKSTTAGMLQQLLGFQESGETDANLNHALNMVQEVGQNVLAVTSSFLLALLFAFLIVLDLPRLTQSVRELANTKLGFIYDEMADNIMNFGLIMGRALSAQLMIAIINTLLTAMMLYFLNLGEKLAFLSIIVFLCSFIPVAGVFISSVPICLLTLQDGGVNLMLLTIAGIWIIHLIETYVLNPRIFGHHMHINPVLVLVILTTAGKLLHIWGLILGVPVCTYFFGHAIRYRSNSSDAAP